MSDLMDAQEIVERIMSLHWDMAACPCWVCRAGDKLGFAAREHLLPHRNGNSEAYPVPSDGWWPKEEAKDAEPGR